MTSSRVITVFFARIVPITQLGDKFPS